MNDKPHPNTKYLPGEEPWTRQGIPRNTWMSREYRRKQVEKAKLADVRRPDPRPPSAPADIVYVTLRAPKALHKRLAHFAIDREVSIQDVLVSAVTAYLDAEKAPQDETATR